MTDPQIEALLETPIPFSQWLTQIAPDAIVGHSLSAHRCPLAHFINSATGTPHAVSRNCCARGMEVKAFLPPWAERFTYYVDAEHDQSMPITAAQCQSVLAVAVSC